MTLPVNTIDVSTPFWYEVSCRSQAAAGITTGIICNPEKAARSVSPAVITIRYVYNPVPGQTVIHVSVNKSLLVVSHYIYLL